MAAQSPTGLTQRQGKYKYTTPPWKDVYRKRCIKRLQEGRAKLVNRFRNSGCSADKPENKLIDTVMAEEWNIMNLNGNSRDDDVENILDIMEEIRKELMMEEQLLLSEYEDGLRFEEESLCAAIQCLQTDDVICPICKRSPLLQNKQVFFCSCGIRIDTENDGITMDNIRTQLQSLLEQHSNEGCMAEPVFSISCFGEININNMIMSCKTCDFLGVVI